MQHDDGLLVFADFGQGLFFSAGLGIPTHGTEVPWDDRDEAEQAAMRPEPKPVAVERDIADLLALKCEK